MSHFIINVKHRLYLSFQYQFRISKYFLGNLKTISIKPVPLSLPLFLQFRCIKTTGCVTRIMVHNSSAFPMTPTGYNFVLDWRENAISSVLILCLLEKQTVITWKMYFLRWSLSQNWNAPSRALQMSNWIMHFPDILAWMKVQTLDNS